MYEELVNQLREPCQYENCILCQQAADAIENTSKAYQMMAEAYEAEVTKQKWIPVTERLPERNTRVLVHGVGNADGFWGDQVTAIAERFLFKFFPSSEGEETWSSPWQYFHTDYKITHWMPLPEPPKEDEA